ncbi:hypothetical protein [Tsukamurella strandjordii]|uniref:hypothetical protein n=1 Tax=Tsukamurella strandjordii TaxID=147577 RepID=UPI0039F02095
MADESLAVDETLPADESLLVDEDDALDPPAEPEVALEVADTDVPADSAAADPVVAPLVESLVLVRVDPERSSRLGAVDAGVTCAWL